jgi:hypothetical protein
MSSHENGELGITQIAILNKERLKQKKNLGFLLKKNIGRERIQL